MTQNRQHVRLQFQASVEIVEGDNRQPGQTLNISQGGVFVTTDPVPPFGAKVILEIDLPGVRDTCSIPCVVRWSKAGDGIGLQFESLRAIEVWSLNKLKASLKALP